MGCGRLWARPTLNSLQLLALTTQLVTLLAGAGCLASGDSGSATAQGFGTLALAALAAFVWMVVRYLRARLAHSCQCFHCRGGRDRRGRNRVAAKVAPTAPPALAPGVAAVTPPRAAAAKQRAAKAPPAALGVPGRPAAALAARSYRGRRREREGPAEVPAQPLRSRSWQA
jgi:hypothetical protein